MSSFHYIIIYISHRFILLFLTLTFGILPNAKYGAFLINYRLAAIIKLSNKKEKHMLKNYIALIIFLISSSFIFSLPLFPDISDWEKEIKRLDCVEFLEIEKQYPNNDESFDYDMKIFLTDNRFLQIKYFNPYQRKKNSNFIIARIGDIVPITWGYDSYSLSFHRFEFKYLQSFFESTKSLIDLLKQYDEIFAFIKNLPAFNVNFPYELVDNPSVSNEKPILKSWNDYPSQYIYSNYNTKWNYWEEFKLYQMPVKEYNDYVIAIDREWLCIEEKP